MTTLTATQTAHTVILLAEGECFTEQEMTNPPQVGDRICINNQEFIVKARMFAWSDDLVAGTGPVDVFVKMVAAADSWDD